MQTTNIGQALQHAMREIEKANQRTLYTIFGDAPWTNKERLSDALLSDLIDHFSRLPLSNSDVDSDILGQAYEYLIKKFADATNKKAGEFYTPRSIVCLMVRILDPQEGETIYDPACGTGGMLLEAVHHVREQGRNARVLIIDASKLSKKGRNQNSLTDEHIDQIFTCYKGYQDRTGIARLVTLSDIASNDWNLNIPRYIEPVVQAKTTSIAEAIAHLQTAMDEAYAAEDRLKQLLQEAGLMGDDC